MVLISTAFLVLTMRERERERTSGNQSWSRGCDCAWGRAVTKDVPCPLRKLAMPLASGIGLFQSATEAKADGRVQLCATFFRGAGSHYTMPSRYRALCTTVS